MDFKAWQNTKRIETAHHDDVIDNFIEDIDEIAAYNTSTVETMSPMPIVDSMNITDQIQNETVYNYTFSLNTTNQTDMFTVHLNHTEFEDILEYEIAEFSNKTNASSYV